MTDRNGKSLQGRTLYIPQMSCEAARTMAAAFQSFGVDARPSPEGDARTYELARRHTNGDECLPELVTLGNFLKVTEAPDFAPEKTALLMPTSNGPCRFGQYRHLIRIVLEELGFGEVYLFSPSSADGYEGFGVSARQLVRKGWWAVLLSDLLRKLLLMTRPYEIDAGATESLFHRYLDRLCALLAEPEIAMRRCRRSLSELLLDIRSDFRGIGRQRYQRKPLIGVVGEIFCRLDDFSNNQLVKKIEEYGGETWISDVAEWAWYTNEEERLKLKREGRAISAAMLANRIRRQVMRADEHEFYSLFRDDFRGREEPPATRSILMRSRPYLPAEGSLGEMVLNVGKAVWYFEKGAAGVIDISPFSCMNGIICEGIYPRLSRDLGDLPIRTFYFDGTSDDLDRDVEIFMELVSNCQRQSGGVIRSLATIS